MRVNIHGESGKELGKQEGLCPPPSLFQEGWGETPPTVTLHLCPQHGSRCCRRSLCLDPRTAVLKDHGKVSRPFYQKIDVTLCKEAVLALLTGSQIVLNVLLIGSPFPKKT